MHWFLDLYVKIQSKIAATVFPVGCRTSRVSVFAKVTEVKCARVRYFDVLRSGREMWIIKLIVSAVTERFRFPKVDCATSSCCK